jgi:hypothetical protein
MRTLFLTCLLAVCSLTLSAQIDAKLNAGSALFGGLGLAADFALSENSSVSAGLGYASTKANVSFGNGDSEYKYTRFRIIPEYRYYFNPENGADKFFVGGYGKLSFVNASNGDSAADDTATIGALGILFGNKWVSDGGFVFELNGGVGRNASLGSSDSGNDVDVLFGSVLGIDIRVGIIVGYRFGQ